MPTGCPLFANCAADLTGPENTSALLSWFLVITQTKQINQSVAKLNCQFDREAGKMAD